MTADHARCHSDRRRLAERRECFAQALQADEIMGRPAMRAGCDRERQSAWIWWCCSPQWSPMKTSMSMALRNGVRLYRGTSIGRRCQGTPVKTGRDRQVPWQCGPMSRRNSLDAVHVASHNLGSDQNWDRRSVRKCIGRDDVRDGDLLIALRAYDDHFVADMRVDV